MTIEAKSVFSGHEIVVRISALDQPSSKLYIDGKVVDSSQVDSGNGSILRGSIEDSGRTHIAEIRRRFMFTAPKIFVDGKILELVK